MPETDRDFCLANILIAANALPDMRIGEIIVNACDGDPYDWSDKLLGEAIHYYMYTTMRKKINAEN